MNSKHLEIFLQGNDNLENIIGGVPEEQYAMHEAFRNTLSNNEQVQLSQYLVAPPKERKENKHNFARKLIEDIEAIFDYNHFISLDPQSKNYSAYHLAENLGRRSCTYCNRLYTTTITKKNGGKFMRPQFDHWYPQSKFPLLAVSFYNLIPSCSPCNSSIKKDIELNLADHVHPYVDSTQSEEFYFKYFYSSKLNKYHIYIQIKDHTKRKTFNTLKMLKIDEMYNTHYDELADMIKIRQAYSDKYVEKIKKLFPDNTLNQDDIYRLLFGTEFNSYDFHKRPLSKFKKDILMQLGIKL